MISQLRHERFFVCGTGTNRKTGKGIEFGIPLDISKKGLEGIRRNVEPRELIRSDGIPCQLWSIGRAIQTARSEETAGRSSSVRQVMRILNPFYDMDRAATLREYGAIARSESHAAVAGQ